MIFKWIRRAAAGAFVLAIIALVLARAFLNDSAVPRTDALIPAGAPRVLMAIFPHPDDETTCAGTLLKLHEQGVKTVLVYLTRGEAGPTGGLVSRAELGRTRTQESLAAARALHVDAVEMLDFPDDGLERVDPRLLKAAMRAMIERYRPSALITYDDRIGLYGHPDHRVSALDVRELVEEGAKDPKFPVRRLYQVTLPPGTIRAALAFSKTFRERYPRDPALGLPKPDLAVDISAYGSAKKAALEAHRTQRQVLGDLQPMINALPGWLYYRVFDTEYYSRAIDRG